MKSLARRKCAARSSSGASRTSQCRYAMPGARKSASSADTAATHDVRDADRAERGDVARRADRADEQVIARADGRELGVLLALSQDGELARERRHLQGEVSEIANPN